MDEDSGTAREDTGKTGSGQLVLIMVCTDGHHLQGKESVDSIHLISDADKFGVL